MKISQRGQELVNMRKELDDAKGNQMLIEALGDYVKKNTSAQEFKLVTNAETATELRAKLASLKEYAESEEDLYQNRVEKISKMIMDLANPKKISRHDPQKAYKLKYTLEGNFADKTFTMTRKFGLGERFLREYFGVLENKELKRLMENGFMSDYVGHRIPYVLNELLKGVHENNKKGLTIDISSSYYSQDHSLFNVDLKITFSDEETNDAVARKLAVILTVIEDRFSLTEF